MELTLQTHPVVCLQREIAAAAAATPTLTLFHFTCTNQAAAATFTTAYMFKRTRSLSNASL